MKRLISLLLCIVLAIYLLTACNIQREVIEEFLESATANTEKPADNTLLSHKNYNGIPYMEVNDNVPYFTEQEKTTTEVFENYSELDNLGRCGVAFANVCKALMPTEERESLSSVTPSGWKNKQYDSEIVDGGWIYNRAHIIGFQLAGEQANEKNLITGTRYFNVDGMLTFENMVADYIKETDNHVLYRVTPVYDGDNLVAEGVVMEAWSIEDNGDGICFNVFCFNVQPMVEIDYKTGDNWLSENKNENNTTTNDMEQKYVLNTNSKKYHKPDCNSVNDISDKNKEDYVGTKSELEKKGYKACGTCKP